MKKSRLEIRCYRCNSEIKGKSFVVDGKYLGPSCYSLLEKRNRIRAQCELAESTSVSFIETEICKSSCLDCIYFNQPVCPQEEAFEGILGRKR